MTDKTIKLDPKAVEAAAEYAFERCIYVHWTEDEPVPAELVPPGVDPDDVSPYDIELSWEQWNTYNLQLDSDSMDNMSADDIRKIAHAAITAYIAAIEPQLRERVEGVVTLSGATKSALDRDDNDAFERDIVLRDKHIAELYALFGLEAE